MYACLYVRACVYVCPVGCLYVMERVRKSTVTFSCGVISKEQFDCMCLGGLFLQLLRLVAAVIQHKTISVRSAWFKRSHHEILCFIHSLVCCCVMSSLSPGFAGLAAKLPSSWQDHLPSLMRAVDLAASSTTAAGLDRDVLRSVLVAHAAAHPCLRSSLTYVCDWAVLHGVAAHLSWEDTHLCGAIFTTSTACLHCGGALERRWHAGTLAKCLLEKRRGQIAHIPSACVSCEALHWHHYCEPPRDSARRQQPPWCARRCVGNKHINAMPLVGDWTQVTHMLITSTSAVEIALLRGFERLLFRGAIAFEAFLKAYFDEIGGVCGSQDEEDFRWAYNRYAFIELLAAGAALGDTPVLGLVPTGTHCVDTHKFARRGTRPLGFVRRNAQHRLEQREVAFAEKVFTRMATSSHYGSCTNADRAMCSVILYGDGNNKLFTPVCPVIPDPPGAQLLISAAEAPLCLPCGDQPTKSGACLLHACRAPPRPPNRRRRVMPRGAGTQEAQILRPQSE